MPIPGIVNLMVDTETPLGTVGWPSIGLVCYHCSFVRIHSAYPSIEQAMAVLPSK